MLEDLGRRMRRRALQLTTAIATGAAVTACGGGSSSATPAACGAPNLTMVYPAPGATGIPANLPGIVFATTSGLNASSEALVVPAGSSQFLAFAVVAPAPASLPAPNALPGYANPVYQESAANGIILPAATPISVYYNDLSSNCNPSLIATFTTQ